MNAMPPTTLTTSPVILFDMDETLAATGLHWRQAEQCLFAAMGKVWDIPTSQQFKGMNAPDLAAKAHQLCHPDLSLENCQTTMRQALIDAFQANPPAPMAGAQACVRRLASSYRLAVASGSPMELIQLTMDHLGISSCFQVLLSSESVARGKPNPDVFLAAAQAMNAPPSHCLVIEDSLVGVQAAQAAGMKSIVIPSLPLPELATIASRVCKSLEEVDQAMIRQIMQQG